MNKKQKLENIFNYIFNETNRSVTDYISIEDILKMTSFQELYEQLESEYFFDVEIIYYAKAMDYLKENDPSLTDSLIIAFDMCYSPCDLNSEKLASILASKKVIESFSSYYDEIQDILTNNE